jgi:hypothetical protein
MLPDQNLVPKTDSTVSTTAAQDNPVSTKTNSNPIELNRSNQNTAKAKTETNPIPKKQPLPIEKPLQKLKTNQGSANPKKVNSVKVNKTMPKAVMPKYNDY